MTDITIEVADREKTIVRTSVISSSGIVRLNKYACVPGYAMHLRNASQHIA